MQIVPAGSEKNKNVSHVAVATRKELYCSFIEVRLGKLEEDLRQQQVGWNECELVFNCELEIEPELEQVLVNGELAQHHVQEPVKPPRLAVAILCIWKRIRL